MNASAEPNEGREPSASSGRPAVQGRSAIELDPQDIADAVRKALTDSDLKQAFPDGRRLEARILEHADELARQLHAELSAVEAAKVSPTEEPDADGNGCAIGCGLFALLCLGFAVVGLYGVLYASVGLRLGWDPREYLDPDPGQSLLDVSSEFLVGALFLGGLAALIGWFFYEPNPALAERARERERVDLALRSALKDQVGGLARRLANTPEFMQKAAVVTLSTTTAPALVEQDYSRVTISGATQRLIEDLIRQHQSTAIGLAGPRGAGKTTIMRKLETDLTDFVVVYAPVPVYYSASDFVRHLHRQVVLAILKGERQSDAGQGHRRTMRRRIGVIVAVGGMVVFATLGVATVLAPAWLTERSLGLEMSRLAPLLLAGASVFLLLALLASRSPAGHPARTARTAGELAAQELQRLTWRTSQETSTRWGLPLGKASLEFGRGDKLEERELSHPDSVSAFQEFTRRYLELPGHHPLLVTVDELDKIADADKAVEMINGAKDLLHMDRVHFVVSVSEEALAAYALRGIAVRDVFDSAFDDVLDVKPLKAAESLAVLERRVVDFPDAMGLLCHALAGGLPRDLIRAARHCVTVRRASGAPVSIGDVADALTRGELFAALDSAVRVSAGDDASLDQLLHLRERAAAGIGLKYDIVGSALRDVTGSQAGALVVLAGFLATTYEYFAAPRDRVAWQGLLDDGSAARYAESLAQVRRTIPVSARAASADLAAVRLGYGLRSFS